MKIIYLVIYINILIETNEYSNITLISSLNNNKINPIYNLSKNETIKLQFINDKCLPINNCQIRYQYIIKEPEYQIFDKYSIYKNISFGNDDENFFNSLINEYKGKISNYSIFLKNIELTNCINICLYKELLEGKCRDIKIKKEQIDKIIYNLRYFSYFIK